MFTLTIWALAWVFAYTMKCLCRLSIRKMYRPTGARCRTNAAAYGDAWCKVGEATLCVRSSLETASWSATKAGSTNKHLFVECTV